MRLRSLLALASIAIALSCSTDRKAAGHEGTAEEAAALKAVQRFFDTMASKDVAGATAVLDPEGSFVSVRWSDDGQRVVRRRSNRAYLDGLPAETRILLERMWDSDVQVHGPIATVRTPYDFHIDGVFSHCGIDMFQLLHTDGGWIITGGTYTVERTGCQKSPLGPPEK
jgi:ketosteroid isomerase-like protein